MSAIQGTVIKGVGGFYYVKTPEGVCECKACGRFRLEGITPYAGDRVELSPPTATSGGYVEEILPRRNVLTRPPVANIDLLLVVISAHKPKPDFLLVDKLLIYAKNCGILPALVVNKTDLDVQTLECVRQDYAQSGAPILGVSARTGAGLDALKALIKDKITCFSGQSAVGKSSLINALCPALGLETGGLSKKTARGRHTTRHTELIYLPALNAMVADTPGFSILQSADLEPEALKGFYPEFDGTQCRFASCLHYKEPDCGVKELFMHGALAKARYERYIAILEELIERREKRYD